MSSSPTEAGAALADVTMPQMGVSVAEGTIVEWKKRVGDWISADETIVEISTDKIETEVPSPASGRVSEILVEPGTTVEVGTVLARIDTAARPGEAHADERPPSGVGAARPGPTRAEAVADQAAAAPGPIGAAPPDGERAGTEAQAPTAPRAAPSPESQPPPVSPVVRRIATEHDVDLSSVEGTGRRGRVTKRDVLAFVETGDQRSGEVETETGKAAPTEAADEPSLHIDSPYREEDGAAAAPAAAGRPGSPDAPPAGRELSPMRRQIADHMLRSLRTAAHCTTIVEADMSRVEAARGRLSYLPFVARATIGALREFPALNATWDGDRLVDHAAVHLGIAVSLGEDGLIVPVIHDAHELSHEGLAARMAELAERARARRLAPEEVRGATFTITNPGRFGALLATPIINQPQVAILDLEAVVKRPVVVGGDSIAIRPMTYLCMSWDHRALDGAYAAQFASSVRRRLEEWHG